MIKKVTFAFAFIIFLSGLVLASENKTCVDSDGGINYSIAGTATFVHPTTGSLFNESDFCMNNITLSEQYCKGDYEIGTSIHQCDGICSNGACTGIPPAPQIPRCFDTDGGDAPYKKGTASYNDSNTGNLISQEDFCMTDTVLSEQYCTQTNNGALKVSIANRPTICPYGCKD